MPAPTLGLRFLGNADARILRGLLAQARNDELGETISLLEAAYVAARDADVTFFPGLSRDEVEVMAAHFVRLGCSPPVIEEQRGPLK